MRLKIILLCVGLLLNLSACGDKGGTSRDMILAVKTLEADNGFSNDERLQVALLNADNIKSEGDAQAAAEQAQWIFIDRFSSNNLVFKEEMEDESLFASASSSVSVTFKHNSRHRRHKRYRQRYRRHNYRDYRGNQYGRRYRPGCHRRNNCWKPYRHDHWAGNRRVRWRYRGCSSGSLFYRGNCVRPYTPVRDYYWSPRYVYVPYVRVRTRIIFYW